MNNKLIIYLTKSSLSRAMKEIDINYLATHTNESLYDIYLYLKYYNDKDMRLKKMTQLVRLEIIKRILLQPSHKYYKMLKTIIEENEMEEILEKAAYKYKYDYDSYFAISIYSCLDVSDRIYKQNEIRNLMTLESKILFSL